MAILGSVIASGGATSETSDRSSIATQYQIPGDPEWNETIKVIERVVGRRRGTEPGLFVLFQELDKVALNDLFVLRTLSDPCARTEVINCGALSNEMAKPAIEMAVEARKVAMENEKARRGQEDARNSRIIALGGLAVSFVSLILSGLTFLRTRASATV